MDCARDLYADNFQAPVKEIKEALDDTWRGARVMTVKAPNPSADATPPQSGSQRGISVAGGTLSLRCVRHSKGGGVPKTILNKNEVGRRIEPDFKT